MKLLEFLELLPTGQSIVISIMGSNLYEGDVVYYDYGDYEINEIYTYGDIKEYNRPYVVICIDCKS